MTISSDVSFTVCVDAADNTSGEFGEVRGVFPAAVDGIDGVGFVPSLADGPCVLRGIEPGDEDEVLIEANDGVQGVCIGFNTVV